MADNDLLEELANAVEERGAEFHKHSPAELRVLWKQEGRLAARLDLWPETGDASFVTVQGWREGRPLTTSRRAGPFHLEPGAYTLETRSYDTINGLADRMISELKREAERE